MDDYCSRALISSQSVARTITVDFCSPEMLSGMFSKMGSSLFASLPTSTNAVEAHNIISKSSTPEPLNIAMLMTYKEDMLAALEHLACLKGISTLYEVRSLEAQKKRPFKQNEARRKRRAREDDDAEGPPDKQRDFQGMYVCIKCI